MGDKITICHRCTRLLTGGRIFLAKTPIGRVAFCVNCIKEGYLRLIGLDEKSEEIEVVIKDFRKFLRRFKISIES